MTSRKQPGVAFWAAVVVVVVLVAYPLSFGPACWISSRAQPSGQVVSVVYYPVIRLFGALPESLNRAVAAYILLGLAPDKSFATDPRGIRFIRLLPLTSQSQTFRRDQSYPLPGCRRRRILAANCCV